MTPDETQAMREKVVAYLRSREYTERDADGSDFQFHQDRSLRFKIGTAYSEVTITVWEDNKQTFRAIRITQNSQFEEAKHTIDKFIADRAAS